jgi:hypothetical protein
MSIMTTSDRHRRQRRPYRDIADDDVGPQSLELAQGTLAGRHHTRLGAVPFHKRPRQLERIRFVVDQKNANARELSIRRR